MIYLFYYLLVLIILVILDKKLYSKIQKLTQRLVYDIERFFYDFYVELLDNKDQLVNFKKSLELFFKQRNLFIQKNHYSLYDMEELLMKSIDEKKYFYDLIGKDTNLINEAVIRNQIQELYKNCSFKVYINNILIIMTLGFYKIFANSKNYC